MRSTGLKYPALYESAGAASAEAQRGSLWTIRTEYFLLLLVSISLAFQDVLSIDRLIVTLLLVILAGLFVFKVIKKLDQDWYRSRALAESVKTSTWRFCMRAHPFEDAERIETPKRNFREFLRNILTANQNIAQNLVTEGTEQVTASMLEVRQMELPDRISFYIKHRVDDQGRWYARKSLANKKALRRWVVVTILIYISAAIALYADEIGYPQLTRIFDPLIVLVTSILGWIQIKRHGELTASYNLTAHEIGIIKSNSDGIRSEQAFSDFVNEAELAFSREHTQWMARRDAA